MAIDFDEVKRAFANTLGLEVEEQDYRSFAVDNGGIQVESVGDVDSETMPEGWESSDSTAEREWMVFESEEDAEACALAQVTEMLESEPENFTQSWLESFVSIYATDRRLIAQEDADSLYSDKSDREIQEEYEDKYGEPEEEKDVEDMREELASDYADDVEEQMKDPIQYFVKEQGIYSIEDLMKAPFIRIDVEAAAQDAVDTDGVAHFLDGYDGSEMEITDPETGKVFICYGTN